MTVRTFNGSSDYIRVTAPAYYSGDFTWVALVKRASTSSYDAVFNIGSADSNPNIVIEFTDADELEYKLVETVGVDVEESDITWAHTNWQLIAVTYDTAQTDLQKHKFHSTVTDSAGWTHEFLNASSGTLSSAPDNWVSAGSPFLDFGRWEPGGFNYFDGMMGMQALNIGTALSDSAINALAGGNSATYATAGFDHLWEFNQASTGTAVEDVIGSLDQTALSGTTATGGSDPSTSLYSFAAVWPPVDNPAYPPLMVTRSSLRIG